MTDRDRTPDEVARENAAGLAEVQAVIDAGPYGDTWDSLAAYEVPRWFREAKFGIFVHWSSVRNNLLVRHDGTVGAAQ